MIPFSWKNFLAVDRPQNFSSSDLKEPVTFYPPMEIQICSFGKALLIHLPVLWAAMKAFFARLSTLMLIRFFREQSRHLSLCHWHATERICIVRGMAEQIQVF
jgi:hypothetical protein